jgi:anhydro-N-acetylmuramic acid kinase
MVKRGPAKDGVWALGLMSGTSMDGIDAALLRTDGRAVLATGASTTMAYDPAFRARLRGVLRGRGPVAAVERELTAKHAEVVRRLLDLAGMTPSAIAYIGLHGQTIDHAPAERRTWQIGDGALLARESAITVISDFRSRDVAEGGEGAPLAPLYHAALARRLERPLAVLNVGGVSNVTWIGAGEMEVLAFDCGPGNAMIDDWVAKHTGSPFDRDGALAMQGRVDETILARLLENPYFTRSAPKSLDRDHFDPSPVEDLAVADGAATLTAFTAAAVQRGLSIMPAPPGRWLVSGGGRHNSAIMAALAARLPGDVEPVEAVGWDGDALEAQAFAYLAVRVARGLPTSLPSTTGVPRATSGGRIDTPPTD